VIPYDKWSHERIRGLLTYMRYTNRHILYYHVKLLRVANQCVCMCVAITDTEHCECLESELFCYTDRYK